MVEVWQMRKKNKEIHELLSDNVIPQIKTVKIFDKNVFQKVFGKNILLMFAKTKRYFVDPNNSRIVTLINCVK